MPASFRHCGGSRNPRRVLNVCKPRFRRSRHPSRHCCGSRNPRRVPGVCSRRSGRFDQVLLDRLSPEIALPLQVGPYCRKRRFKHRGLHQLGRGSVFRLFQQLRGLVAELLQRPRELAVHPGQASGEIPVGVARHTGAVIPRPRASGRGCRDNRTAAPLRCPRQLQ